MKELEQKAEDLTQQYFQQFGGITCNWDNVRKIIQERLEVEFYLGEENAKLKARIEQQRELKKDRIEECEELKTKIKKMKCCGNCKSMQNGDCSFKKMEYFKSDDCKKWELAEWTTQND